MQCSLCNLSIANDARVQALQIIQFQLNVDGNHDCNYYEEDLDDDAIFSDDVAVDSDDDLSNASLVLEEGVSKVTIVPGMQLTPYS